MPLALQRLWMFLFLCLAASWAIWLSPFGREGTFSLTLLGWRIAIPILLVKLLLGNCVPGAIALVFAYFDGKQQLHQMTSSLLRWRVPFRYYFYACAFPLVVFYASSALTSLCFPSPGPLLSPRRLLLELVLTLPFGPLWEELAWRAYSLRQLQAHYSQLKSAMIIGLYWATWHIPLWSLSLRLSGTSAALWLSAAIITIFSLSIIFTFLYNRAVESLPVVIVLHAVYSSTSDNIFANVRTGQLEFIGLAAVLFACVALALGRTTQRPV